MHKVWLIQLCDLDETECHLTPHLCFQSFKIKTFQQSLDIVVFRVEFSWYGQLKNGYDIIYSSPTELLIETLSC